MSANAGAIRAGRAFVELFADDSKLVSGLNAISGKLTQFGGVAIAAGTAVLAPLAAAVHTFVELGSELKDASDRTGVAADELSALKYAAEQSDASFGDLQKGLRAYYLRLDAAKSGNKAAIDSFAALGLTVDDLAGLSVTDQLALMADGIAGIEDSAKRAAVANALFGKSGQTLLPLLRAGGDALRKTTEEAKRLGITLGQEDAEAAEAFGDSMDTLQSILKYGVAKAGAALVPTLQNIIKYVIEGAAWANHFVDRNRELVKIVAAVGVGLVVAGGALLGLSAAFAIAGAAITGVGTVLGVVSSVVGTIISPVGAVIGVIAALAAGLGYLGYVWATTTESGKAFTGFITDQLSALRGRVIEVWGGIVGAMKGGDLELAARIAWAGVRREASIAWNGILNASLQAWSGIRLGWSDASDWLARSWLSLKQSLSETWHSLKDGHIRTILSMIDTIQDIWDNFGAYLSDGIDGAFKVILSIISQALSIISSQVERTYSMIKSVAKLAVEMARNPLGAAGAAGSILSDQKKESAEIAKNQAIEAAKAANEIAKQQAINAKRLLTDKGARDQIRNKMDADKDARRQAQDAEMAALRERQQQRRDDLKTELDQMIDRITAEYGANIDLINKEISGYLDQVFSMQLRSMGESVGSVLRNIPKPVNKVAADGLNLGDASAGTFLSTNAISRAFSLTDKLNKQIAENTANTAKGVKEIVDGIGKLQLQNGD